MEIKEKKVKTQAQVMQEIAEVMKELGIHLIAILILLLSIAMLTVFLF